MMLPELCVFAPLVFFIAAEPYFNARNVLFRYWLVCIKMFWEEKVAAYDSVLTLIVFWKVSASVFHISLTVLTPA